MLRMCMSHTHTFNTQRILSCKVKVAVLMSAQVLHTTVLAVLNL